MWQFLFANFKCRREIAVTLKRRSSWSTWGHSLKFISMFNLNWAIFKVPISLPQTLLHSWCSGLHTHQKLVLRQAPATYSKAPHTFLPCLASGTEDEPQTPIRANCFCHLLPGKFFQRLCFFRAVVGLQQNWEAFTAISHTPSRQRWDSFSSFIFTLKPWHNIMISQKPLSVKRK